MCEPWAIGGPFAAGDRLSFSEAAIMAVAGPFELITPAADWGQAVRPLLHDPGRVAVGRVRWHPHDTGVELLAQGFDVRATLPTGASQPPMADWAALVIEPGSPWRTLTERMEAMHPRDKQTVALLALSADDRSHWDGAVWHEGTVRPLQGVRVIGPGMLHLARRNAVPPISDAARLRWSRTIGALGEDLWRKVYDAHVLLIGCGRNGTLLAWLLTCLGVSRWTLVDGDRLGRDLENHDAMPGLRAADAGRKKVRALARRLVAFRTDLTVRGHCRPVMDVLDRLRHHAERFDLIATCVDDDTPRLAASWLSRELLAPHLDVGTSVQRQDGRLELAGDVRLLLPFEGCVSCVGGLADREATLYEFAAPRGALHRGEPAVWSQQRAGSLVHLNAMTTGAAVELWLALLRGEHGSFWQRLSGTGERGFVADGATVVAAEGCSFCRAAS
jgi:hypothetical protein